MTALIWKPAAIAALALALAIGAWAVLWHGPVQYRAGVASERARAMEALKAQLDERNQTNEQIRNLDDAGLCAALGGVFSDGVCQ